MHIHTHTHIYTCTHALTHSSNPRLHTPWYSTEHFKGQPTCNYYASGWESLLLLRVITYMPWIHLFFSRLSLKKKKDLIYSALELMTQVYIIFLKILSVVQWAAEW